MNKSYEGTQAITRAVAVLQALRAKADRLAPQEIAQRTGINRSTVYRILSVLEGEGLVASDENGRYRLGPELIVLGALALGQINLREIARPVLADLAQQTGETVDLEVLHGQEVLIIEEITGDHLLNTSGNIGRCYPAERTSTGKVLIAALPDAEVHARLPQVTAPELASIRAHGYATSYEELEAHLNAIGAAIHDHRGQAIAAISISGPAARLTRTREREIAMLLRAACATISARLGYSSG